MLSSLAGAAWRPVLWLLGAPGSLISHLEPKLLTLFTPRPLLSSWNTEMSPLRKLRGLPPEECSPFPAFTDVPRQTMEIRDKTQIFFRQDVPTQGKCCFYPPLASLGGLHCASPGMQVLLSVLQSVSKLNPTEQREKQTFVQVSCSDQLIFCSAPHTSQRDTRQT